ncbi:MAG TPA: hypothetical protein VI278_12345 [Nitrososphaeraceae archaeon]
MKQGNDQLDIENKNTSANKDKVAIVTDSATGIGLRDSSTRIFCYSRLDMTSSTRLILYCSKQTTMKT